MRSFAALLIVWLVVTPTLLVASDRQAEQRYSATGLVVDVDLTHQTLAISCQTIPGYMDAMVMPFSVHDAKVLMGLRPGLMVDFTLVAGAGFCVCRKYSHSELRKCGAGPVYGPSVEKPARAGCAQGASAAAEAMSNRELGVPDFQVGRPEPAVDHSAPVCRQGCGRQLYLHSLRFAAILFSPLQ